MICVPLPDSAALRCDTQVPDTHGKVLHMASVIQLFYLPVAITTCNGAAHDIVVYH